MLPKLSQRVSDVIKLANTIARDYEQDYVGTEHVLLAVAREGTGRGAQLLQQRSVTKATLKSEIDALIKNQLEDSWVFGRLPGTPHFKNVIATAIEECQELGSKEVCTEHLLLALLKESGSVAFQALKALGVSAKEVRSELINAGDDANKKRE